MSYPKQENLWFIKDGPLQARVDFLEIKHFVYRTVALWL